MDWLEFLADGVRVGLKVMLTPRPRGCDSKIHTTNKQRAGLLYGLLIVYLKVY